MEAPFPQIAGYYIHKAIGELLQDEFKEEALVPHPIEGLCHVQKDDSCWFVGVEAMRDLVGDSQQLRVAGVVFPEAKLLIRKQVVSSL